MGSAYQFSSESANAFDGDQNDNSNPQQGSGASNLSRADNQLQHNPTLDRIQAQGLSQIVPPTMKDPRKIFVGGLPPDSKSAKCSTFELSHFSIINSLTWILF
jgi:hypothetical protein